MTDPRQPDGDALADLLSSPLDDAPRPRDRRRAAVIVLAAVTVIVLGVAAILIFGGSDDPDSAATNEAVSTAGTAAGSDPSGTSGASEGAGTTAIPARPGVPGYPESRILAAGGGAELVMVMFGGADPGGAVVDDVVADTWIYWYADDLWHRVDGVGPTGRLGAASAYDTQSGVLVLFGGATGRPNFCRVVRRCAPGENAEVWGFSPETGEWAEQPESGGPTGRFGAAAGYHAGADRLVLFGGSRILETNAAVELYRETWIYDFDTNTWTEMSPAASPPARAYGVMAYDPGSERMLLFGGNGVDEENDSTVWAYDLEADEWTAYSIEGDQPDPTWDSTFVYVDSIAAAVLVGGEGPLTREIAEGVTATEIGWTERVWWFDPSGGTWSEQEPFPGPVAGHIAGYDPIGERLVVHAQGYTVRYDPIADTWEVLDSGE